MCNCSMSDQEYLQAKFDVVIRDDGEVFTYHDLKIKPKLPEGSSNNFEEVLDIGDGAVFEIGVSQYTTSVCQPGREALLSENPIDMMHRHLDGDNGNIIL